MRTKASWFRSDALRGLDRVVIGPLEMRIAVKIPYTAFLRVSALSEPRFTADSPEQVLQYATASLRRSRRRLWNVSQRPPIPTAVLSITTESVPAGTARSVTLSAASQSAPRADAPTGGCLTGIGLPCASAAALSDARFPVICCVVGVRFRFVSARCITGFATHCARYRSSYPFHLLSDSRSDSLYGGKSPIWRLLTSAS
jgi:hypothetical protein